jgi:hypothetical protein
MNCDLLKNDSPGFTTESALVQLLSGFQGFQNENGKKVPDSNFLLTLRPAFILILILSLSLSHPSPLISGKEVMPSYLRLTEE